MRKEKWLVAAKKADFNDWANVFHISPVLARIIRNRDVLDTSQVKKYLCGNMKDDRLINKIKLTKEDVLSEIEKIGGADDANVD